MSAIQRRIEEVKNRAAKSFENHSIKVILDTPTHKHYSVGGPSGFDWYNVIVVPDYLFITGDLGDFVFWRPGTDMWQWAKSSLDSLSYMAKKCVAGNWREDFCREVAAEWIHEERATLAAERHDSVEVEDNDELKRIDDKFEVLDNLVDYLDNEYAFTEMVYNEYSDGDCEILDSFWNYSYSFLYCREALIFLLGRL